MAKPLFDIRSKDCKGLSVALWKSPFEGYNWCVSKAYFDKKANEAKKMVLYISDAQARELIQLLQEALIWVNSPQKDEVSLTREKPHTPTKIEAEDIPYVRQQSLLDEKDLRSDDDEIPF